MKHSLKVNKTDEGTEGLLSLTGDLTMAHARETKEALLQAIKEVDTLHLDLKEIDSVDVSFVQLMCATHRECFLSEKKVFLQGGVGTSMQRILEQAGYCKQLGCSTDAKENCLWGAMGQ